MDKHDSMKLATVVVAYHPTAKVLENIASYAAASDELYVWDNTPGGSPLLAGLATGIVLHHEHANMGLGYAYNRAMEHALEAGCTHLMTMDQDSRFEDFANYRRQVAECTDEKIAIFTPPVNHDIDSPGYRYRIPCQSGSIFPLQILKSIGGFREDLFIGMVDAEISLKASERGYKIYQVVGCNLAHEIGSGRKVKRFGKTVEVSDYSPLRHYYDSRNRILLWHEFPYDADRRFKRQMLANRMKTVVKIALFESHKYAKIKAIVRGICNGLRNRAIPY